MVSKEEMLNATAGKEITTARQRKNGTYSFVFPVKSGDKKIKYTYNYHSKSGAIRTYTFRNAGGKNGWYFKNSTPLKTKKRVPSIFKKGELMDEWTINRYTFDEAMAYFAKRFAPENRGNVAKRYKKRPENSEFWA